MLTWFAREATPVLIGIAGSLLWQRVFVREMGI